MALEQEVLYFEPNIVDYNVENLTVGIYLDVEILDRSLADYGVESGKNYKGSVTIGESNINFLEGENNVLTTSYSDVTILELSNGGNKESIGIENINIKYTSWYFPEVNIKFVDVRGNSVFNSMEKKADGEGDGSFFHCLFDFPYPIFKLTVKGYYGKPVTYRLTVKDMRSTFNSNTGNFEIAVNFIGYMYSYLTDIPMSLLFLAPYIEYNNVSSDLGVFSSGKDANAPIPTFVQFIQNITESIKSEQGNTDLQNYKQLSEFYVTAKNNINTLISLYERINEIKDKYFDVEKKENSYEIIMTFNAEKAQTNNWSGSTADIGKNIVNNIDEIVKLTNPLKNIKEDFDLVICKNTIHTNTAFADNACILKDSYNIKDSFNIFYDYDNDKIVLDELKKHIEKSIDNITNIIDELKNDCFENVTQWEPTIRNIFEMVLAHMDKFEENMSRCIDNIKNAKNRKLTDIPKYETDCNSNSKDITVYPFPAFYDSDDKYTWIGEVPIARDYNEHDFINKIISASTLASTKLEEAFTSYEDTLTSVETFPINGIPLLYYDLKYGNEYKNLNKDFGVLVQYPNGDRKQLPPALQVLAYRYILWKVYNSNVNIKANTFGALEALNFLDISHNAKDFPESSLWQDDNNDSCYKRFAEFVSSACDKLKDLYPFTDNDSSNKEAILPITYKKFVENNSSFEKDDVYCKFEGEMNASDVYVISNNYNNGVVLLDTSYNEIMNGVSLQLLNNGIEDENYSKVFPSEMASIEYYDKVNSLYVGYNGKPISYILNMKDKINELTANVEEKDKIAAFLTEIEKRDNNELRKGIANAIKGKETYCYKLGVKSGGEVQYSFEDMGWIIDMTDFYPRFKLDVDNQKDALTLNSLEKLIKQKGGWFRELLNINKDSNVYCSFSCKKYWGDDITILDAKEDENILSEVLTDFLSSIGMPNNTFNFSRLYGIEDSGICRIPAILAIYIGKEIKRIKESTNVAEINQYAKISNLSITEYLFEYYTNNWKAVAQKIFSTFLTDKSTNGEREYDDLLYISSKNNAKQYFFRVLNSEIRRELENILSKNVYIYSTHGNSMTTNDTFNIRSKIAKISPKEVESNDEVNSVVISFLETVRNNIGFKNEDKPTKEVTGVPTERKMGVYDTVKNLYDRWKFGTYKKTTSNKDFSIKMDNFVFRNALNKDVSDELKINLDNVANLINSIYKGGNDMSVYSFLYDICSKADCLMLALPVNVFDAVNSTEKLSKLFTPHNYITARDDAEQTTFIVTQRQKDSQHLSFSPNVSSYKDDGVDFIKYIHKSDNSNSNNMGVFGVTYSFGDQHFFKDIQVSMDKPKVTEQSIASTMRIAEEGGKGGSSNIGRTYHDLFDTYSNHSYHCTVNMMGNAQIMPMMYFQLNNIPMFKGGYIITSVEHTLNNQGMTTTFTGNRLNKHSFDLNLPQIYDFSLVDNSDTGEYKAYETSNSNRVKNSIGKDVEQLNYSKEKTKILIDAGHYMSRTGKQSPDLNPETDMFPMDYEERQGEGVLNPKNASGEEVYLYREYWGNRKIATELYNKLKTNGYDAICLFNPNKDATSNSKFSSEVDRIYEEQKRNGGSTIVISIHSNAAANSGWGTGNRWEIYKQNPNGEEVTSYAPGDSRRRVYPYHPETSHTLAKCIALAAKDIFGKMSTDAIYPVVNGKKMVVKTEPQVFTSSSNGYRPTTYSKAPSVLSENLFHDTKEHVKFLGSKKGRTAIVNLHYEGIVKFFDEINKK